MKPFNYEEARAGKPVCTRDGREARIVDWDYMENYPLLAVITEKNGTKNIHAYTEKGAFVYSAEADNDLMMKSERHELWVIILKRKEDGKLFCSCGYYSRQSAEDVVGIYYSHDEDLASAIDIVKVYEWED